ncbi:unnamed protein product [Paramecium primaurelia]|uniref:Ubiquitinyl hydrolase 1 n=1 Tax=Paramecium primaurelia TaxID=5886 RepID=A0A8S1JWE8_PARPR|nr:unnamed protein product [Paramecium primaurelia]
MLIKTKGDVDDNNLDRMNDDEITNLVVPQFPEFKHPGQGKQVLMRPASKQFLNSPSKLEDSLSGSTKITQVNSAGHAYDYIVNRFLQTIRKHLNSPQRSEVEGQIIRTLISQQAKLQYMLHIDWAKYYTSYLQHINTKVPGPINNQPFFADQCSTDTIYKPNLKQDVDFVLLNRNTWMFIHSLYGGGPEVSIQDYSKGEGFENSTQKPTLSRVSSMQSGLMDTVSYMSITLPFQKSQFELPPIGFYNESNYCFMHAALQTILSVEQINCWMMNEGKKIATQQSDKYRWLNAYLEIITIAVNKKAGAFIKIQLLKQLIKNKFDPRLQHDSQEFLRYFIEQLTIEIQGQLKYDQPITEIVFQGQMMSLIKCDQCNQQSTKFESFLDLSLSMNKLQTLEKCLRLFFAQEILSDHYQCENCYNETRAVKKYVIGTPPLYLMIHLKRFQVYPNRIKLNGHVRFPISLDVQEFCSIKAKYKLRSIIVHQGTPERGHYVTFSSRQDQWYYFDDHKIYLVTEQDVLQQQAYVLVYEKVEEYLIDMQ